MAYDILPCRNPNRNIMYRYDCIVPLLCICRVHISPLLVVDYMCVYLQGAYQSTTGGRLYVCVSAGCISVHNWW